MRDVAFNPLHSLPPNQGSGTPPKPLFTYIPLLPRPAPSPTVEQIIPEADEPPRRDYYLLLLLLLPRPGCFRDSESEDEDHHTALDMDNKRRESHAYEQEAEWTPVGAMGLDATPTPVTPAPNAPTTTTVTEAQLQALINQGVAAAMAKAEASRVRNGYNSNALQLHIALVQSSLRLALTDNALHSGMPIEEIDKIAKDRISVLPDMIHGSVKASQAENYARAIELQLS
ncbi:hypothetical protein Tco_1202925 [Tanacetum coccineum]